MQAILQDEPVLDGLREPLRTIVRECLAKDPSQRPTAADVGDRLRALPPRLGDQGLRPDQPGPTDGIAPETGRPPTSTPVRRHRGVHHGPRGRRLPPAPVRRRRQDVRGARDPGGREFPVPRRTPNPRRGRARQRAASAARPPALRRRRRPETRTRPVSHRTVRAVAYPGRPRPQPEERRRKRPPARRHWEPSRRAMAPATANLADTPAPCTSTTATTRATAPARTTVTLTELCRWKYPSKPNVKADGTTCKSY